MRDDSSHKDRGTVSHRCVVTYDVAIDSASQNSHHKQNTRTAALFHELIDVSSNETVHICVSQGLRCVSGDLL